MKKKYYYIDSHTGGIIELSAFENFLANLGVILAIIIFTMPIWVWFSLPD